MSSTISRRSFLKGAVAGAAGLAAAQTLGAPALKGAAAAEAAAGKRNIAAHSASEPSFKRVLRSICVPPCTRRGAF